MNPEDNATTKDNPKRLDHQESSGLHRRRTLYLIRHGEAAHNVLEKKAQEEAKLQAEALHLSSEETAARMEEARKAVLNDKSLRDAPLTERGRQQARECGKRLQQLVDQKITHAPTEAMVSPLTRTLETCQIILDNVPSQLKAHIREEIKERRTNFPPDTPRPKEHLYRYSRSNDRFVMNNVTKISEQDINEEIMVRESKEKLRERASKLFDLLLEMEHRHILVVSHKGYLRELERGLLGLPDSPLFENAELRVYRVVFTKGERVLESIERLA